jgi:ubiquinone/menaquinone biosynthesis C-methylase UbiE
MKTAYDQYLLPCLTDLVCSSRIFARTRAAIVPQAEGRVLEIGIGSGHNLRFYRPGRVQSVTGVDPSAGMTRRARRRTAAIPIPVDIVSLELGEIKAERASFDTIVCTFTLCTIPDVTAAFHEMRRVLRPGGRFLFAEHGRAPDAAVARWQDRLTPLWRPLAGGCHLNRDIPGLIRAGGFTIGELSAGYLSRPRLLTYVYKGWAR